jgi:hypothetical protein
MTRNELNSILAAILTTALECQPCPESMVYIELGSDIAKWETVKEILVAGQLATFENYSIRLTTKGRDLAEKCNAALAAK